MHMCVMRLLDLEVTRDDLDLCWSDDLGLGWYDNTDIFRRNS